MGDIYCLYVKETEQDGGLIIGRKNRKNAQEVREQEGKR
jgi:hypothetical protein